MTTTADSGAGSLRQAIIDAQAAGPDDIVSDAGGKGSIDVGPAATNGSKVTVDTKTSKKQLPIAGGQQAALAAGLF